MIDGSEPIRRLVETRQTRQPLGVSGGWLNPNEYITLINVYINIIIIWYIHIYHMVYTSH
jgi:hypothetical protein